MRGLGDALVDSMAAAIQQMEGYIPPNSQYPQGTVAYRNNNPGNLMYAGQAGAVPGGVAGFAKFSSYDAGYAALKNQIQYQINKGQNLTQFFNQYAPGNTTNAAGAVQTPAATQNYINTVATQLGIDPSIPLISYQNGTANMGDGTSTPSDPTTTPFDFSTIPTLLTDSTTSALDSFNNMDPVTIGAIVVLGAGALYVLFG